MDSNPKNIFDFVEFYLFKREDRIRELTRQVETMTNAFEMLKLEPVFNETYSLCEYCYVLLSKDIGSRGQTYIENEFVECETCDKKICYNFILVY